MTRSATEQPDVDMNSSLAVPAGMPGPTGSATEQPDPAMNHGRLQGEIPGTQLKWKIHVSFPNDMWWAMPHGLSDSILEREIVERLRAGWALN